MELKARDELAEALGHIVAEAGRLIMGLQAAEIEARRKPDGSPVCQADLRAEELILARLAALLPGGVVVAEELFAPAASGPVPERFLLVDPLDGTREYLAGHQDFTVNIALIEGGYPVAGAICAPALDQVYVAGTTAFRVELGALKIIATRAAAGAGLHAVASRSHLNAATEQWLQRRPVVEVQRAGSSLKFCLIARGDADVYPRLAPTMEWDTAAGHAILNAAGGCVLGLDGSPLRYGKRDAGFKNAGFIAWGRAPGR